VKREFQPVTIDALIERAEGYLQQNRQWASSCDNPGSFSLAAEFSAKADAIIETLEKSLHGSHGAVDKGQQYTRSLRKRLDWIKSARGPL
jgi:hypothetical protein